MEEGRSYKLYKKIEANIDVDKFLSGYKNYNRPVEKYYSTNNIGYRLFHSLHGFMHFRISKGDKLKLRDIYYQPNIVSKYIKKNSTVLELGAGQGANLFYLAKKHKDSVFIGVDLMRLKINKKKYSNIKFYQHDYSDLSFIEDNSIDVIYAIETIVHCRNKQKVFNEISRVLKKDGFLIVYDYSLVKDYNEYPSFVQKGIDIVSTCGVSPTIESHVAWQNYFKQAKLIEISTTDYSKNILPDLKRLETLARIVLVSKILAKIIFSIFPKIFCGNILIGLAGYSGFNEKITRYNEWLYTKK